MSSFTNDLVVSPLPDGRKWRICRKFSYHSRKYKLVVIVPTGFVTDFASVPFIFWSFIPKWGKYGKAAIVHDALYQFQSLPRGDADSIFREGMITLGVAKWRVFLMYWAVRLFGWGSYY